MYVDFHAKTHFDKIKNLNKNFKYDICFQQK